MKKATKFLMAVLMCLSINVYAQTSEYPWLIGFGWHAPQMSIGDQFFFKELINVKNWNASPAAAQLRVGRHLKSGISLTTSFSMGTASRFYTSLNNRNFFLDADLTVKYSFANGYLLKERCWFDPYLFAGGGLSYWNNVRGNVEGGFGINFWFIPQFGMYIQESYNYIPGKTIKPVDANARPSYLHHSIGLVARFGGGKDTDKDGVRDDKDKCPDVAGLKELSGCPDTDGDGIADMEDKCPLQKGAKEMAGCPDTDGDGIADNIDNCPEVKGLAALAGCPDTDGDGITDKEDECPTEKGTAALKGCPDTDEDGIADKYDECPNIKGLRQFNGCADRDQDGIADNKDKCPDVAGIAANSGCPEVKLKAEEQKIIQEKLNFSAKNIEFETGSDVIRKTSYDDLDNVADIMQQFAMVKLNIDGHTDNVGDAQKNVDLSIRRAVSVQNYLRNKGVSANRMAAAGYGQARPIADNKTTAGRQKNRRVELNIAQ